MLGQRSGGLVDKGELPVRTLKQTPSAVGDEVWVRSDGSRMPHWVKPLLMVALAATAVIAPIWFFGDASGHDFQFHIASWVEVARQWHEGILFPRWAQWANWGYGEPRFIFYPPASRMIGGAMGLVLPWQAVAAAYIWIAVAGSGMAMWALAREWLSQNEAAAAAVFFAVNPYNLVLVYYRSDFAELLTVAIFPLLVLAVLRIARDGWAQVPFFAVVFCATWMSDAPGAVIATYCATLLLVASYALDRRARTLLSGAVAMLCGFGLAAFYIVPAAWEQRWVNLGVLISGNYDIERNFLFSRAGDPDFRLFNLRISFIATGMILVCVMFAVSAARRREVRELWWLLVALVSAAVFMLVRPSDFLWHLLPKLRFVQFPWRWLDALAPAFALLAAAVSGNRKRWLVWGGVFVLIAATGVAIARTTSWDSDAAKQIAQWVQWGDGYEGTSEFEPAGGDRYALYGVNPDPEEPPIDTIAFATQFDPASGTVVPAAGVLAHAEHWSAEGGILRSGSARPVNLELRVLAFPAWRARVDGKAIPIEATATGAMWLPIPAGDHKIDLRFHRTWDRIVGDAISLFSALLLCVWAARRRIAASQVDRNGKNEQQNSMKRA
jgi:hypothetical protein